jgi:hypothetical protein
LSDAISKASLDQVAALVRGVRLPLEPIGEEFLDVIVEGISEAFEHARATAPLTVAKGNETAVTALLESHLNRRIDEDPLWRLLVTSVGRGVESVNYDGTKLEKRPDLSIVLSKRSRRFPLIVEAKIVDHKSGKTARLYCEKGVERFQIGDYAWGCREAFMLAYVRDGSPQITTLNARLSATSTSGNTQFGTLEGPTARSTTNGELALTRHTRAFVYPCQTPPDQMPGAISLWHIWLA